MAPSITESRQPLSHEWRRHSLVRVRRPGWSAQVSEAAPARAEQLPPSEVSVPKAHTTHDDIAW
jgi:hypothetical protein